jgi:hypothetical protein
VHTYRSRVAEAEGNRTPLTEILGHNGFEDRAAHQDGYASSGSLAMISSAVGAFSWPIAKAEEIVMHDELIQALRSVQSALDDPVDQLDENQGLLAERVLDDIQALLDALSADE